MIAQKAIHFMQNKKDFKAIKVDLEKAHDRFWWDSIFDKPSDIGLTHYVISLIIKNINLRPYRFYGIITTFMIFFDKVFFVNIDQNFVGKGFKDKIIVRQKRHHNHCCYSLYRQNFYFCWENIKILLTNFVTINKILKVYHNTYIDNFCQYKAVFEEKFCH